MKQWQDKVISVVGCTFGFMLIPMIIDSLNGFTVNLVSAGLTMLGLYVMAFTFWTLRLKLSTLANLFSGTMWAVLFILSIL